MGNENKKRMEQKIAEQEKAILDYQKQTGHARPMSRREFLNAGLIQFSGLMALPSVLDIMLRVNPAFAAECPVVEAGGTLMPFVNINLAGGWSAVANWLPRDIGGQLLPSYSRLGSGTAPQTVTAFANNALFTANSNTNGFLAGVRSAATADTISKTSFIGMPVNSNDDTGNNRFDIGGLLAAANLAGEKLPNMGQRDSPTGVNHQSAYNRLPRPPLRVGNVNDILGALGFAGSLAQLSQAQQLSLAKTVKNLSDSQARKLASMSGGENIQNLVDCATIRNIENVQAGTGNVDPRQNAQLAANATTARNGANNTPLWNFGNGGELARAGMVMNAVTGLAGAIGLEMGGYDYHGNPRATTDGRDLTAGRLVGQVLQTAAFLNRPVFIYLTSDGSVVFQDSANAGTDATGDSGNRGAAFMIAFRPGGAPQTAGSQLGGFNTTQTVNTQFVTGANAEIAAAGVFANWAKLSGDTGLIQKVIPNVFSAAQLDQVLVFG